MRELLLGAPHLHYQINIAPVNAQIERGGANHLLERTDNHGALDLAPLFRRQRAMVRCNEQQIIIDHSQPLKQQLGRVVRIDEQQDSLVLLDGFLEVGMRVIGRMPDPGDPLFARQNLQHRQCAT